MLQCKSATKTPCLFVDANATLTDNLVRAEQFPQFGAYSLVDGVRKVKKSAQIVLHCFPPTRSGQIKDSDDLCAGDPNAYVPYHNSFAHCSGADP